MAGYDPDRLFVDATRELADKGLEPRIRLYRVSSDGLKLRALKELTLDELDMASIGIYALRNLGKGFYRAKLFSTKYGRNILERTYDFSIGGDGRDELLEDEEDEKYF